MIKNIQKIICNAKHDAENLLISYLLKWSVLLVNDLKWFQNKLRSHIMTASERCKIEWLQSDPL